MAYPSEKQKNNVQIPGEKTFLHSFQFNLNPPCIPIPYQKTLHYPLDSERYIKPKITSFDIRYSAQLFTRCDLGNSVDKLIMNTYQNYQSNYCPDEIDNQILNETFGVQQQKIENQEYLQNDEINKQPDQQEQQIPIITQKLLLNDYKQIPEVIQQQFQEIKNINSEIIHPHRQVKCKRIFDVIPNIQQNELASFVSREENLQDKQINLIKIDFDLDKLEVLKHFKSKELQKLTDFKFQNKYKFSSNINQQHELLMLFDYQKNVVFANQIKGNFIIHGKSL